MASKDKEKSLKRDSNKDFNLSILIGCGGVFILVFLLGGLSLFLALNYDRNNAQYPGSELVSRHSNYTGLPYQFRWDDAYYVEGNFTAVYNWYSTRFNMGAESRANGGCIQLDSEQSFLVNRNVIVIVCQADVGQRIYVSRSVAVNRNNVLE